MSILLFFLLHHLLPVAEPVVTDTPECRPVAPPTLHYDTAFVEQVRSHYNKRLQLGRDVYGADTTAFWMASLSTYSGRYPADPARPAHIPQRAYLDRYVDAPRGATLYWDMPAVVAAYHLSEITGDQQYRQAAQDYVRAFLARCVAANGVFLWGNHYYYDAFADRTMKFGKRPAPVNYSTETGDLHELRPFAPAWQVFWDIDSAATEREIRTMLSQHVADESTGEFNRHADDRRGHAFLEAGGTLVYSAAWLYAHTQDDSLLALADRIAQYSFRHRNPTTGLLSNEPSHDRWDRYTSTTEVGLWAGCLLAAAELASEQYAPRWRALADTAVSAWLAYGYDRTAEKFYGMLNIADGKPRWRQDDYPYQPPNYADPWEPLFPTHNYPVSLAETCLLLYQQTGRPIYRQACDRWVAYFRQTLPARNGQGGYAEHYGRVIGYLLGYATVFRDQETHALAKQVAQEASDVLFAHGMFRSHPGEYRFDAVDGVGILALSLLWLETGEPPHRLGSLY